jgi:RND family efflux transporter MFP subunit
MKRTILILILLLAVIGGVYYATRPKSSEIILTGIVTTDEVIVSPEIKGRIQQLLVKEGDRVTKGQLLAVIQPQEQLADVAYFANNNLQSADQVKQAEDDLEFDRLTYQREAALFKTHAASTQDYDRARMDYQSTQARVDSMSKLTDAAAAQKDKAMVILGYTKIAAPLGGLVDTRTALQGEVVNAGQAIVTLINEDDLWVRADVEETYIDQIRIGDTMPVTLPSGDVLPGTVFYRGVDADYATQRDVSRTKRDIRTFEIRLRCDNHDRRLAVGMTAYVTLRLGNH